MIDIIVRSVTAFPRVETKIYLDNKQAGAIMLKPAIPDDIVKECKLKVYNLLEDERIGPELRMQDFDKYTSLMNGIVSILNHILCSK